MAGAPFRSQAGAPAPRTLRVYPYLGPPVVLPLAWLLGRVHLFVGFLEVWSVECSFSSSDRMTCIEQRDSPVGTSARRVVEVDAPRAPRLVESSPDAGMEHRQGVEVLTDGEPRVLFWLSAHSDEDRRGFAEAFRRFVDDRPGPRFERRPTGDRSWGPLIFVALLTALLLLLARAVVLPVRLSVVRYPDLLMVEPCRWPLRSQLTGFELSLVSHAECQTETPRRRGGRSWLCLVLADGARVRIADGDGNGLDRSVAQVNAFLAEVRRPST